MGGGEAFAIAAIAVSGIIGALALFIGLPWLILHYVVAWRKAGQLNVDEERILDSDAPGVRAKRRDEEGR